MTDNTALADETLMTDALDLTAIEAEHARWLETEGKEGKRANFRGLELAGVDFSGRHLAEASLRGAHLTGANFTGADLRAADLAEAVLEGANLSNALLAGASFARAHLQQATMSGADLTGANFMASVADGVNLSSAKLQGAILRDANFRRADLSQSFMRDAQMRGAIMTDANLSGADLSGVDCREVSFERARFHDARLQDTNFRAAKLDGVDLQAADFSQAQDVGAEFQTQSLQSERSKLQDEQSQLAHLRANLELRETALAEEKARIDKKYATVAAIETEQGPLIAQLGRYSIGFILRFALWLLLCGGVVAVTVLTALHMDEVDLGRVSVIVAGALAVLLLAFFSMLRSFQTARLLKKFMDGAVEKVSNDVPVIGRAAQAIAPDAAAGIIPGFGKKK